MKIQICGYGTNQPLNKGVPIAEAESFGYATDIAKAMAKCYPGQFFGYVHPENNKRYLWRQLDLEHTTD